MRSLVLLDVISRQTIFSAPQHSRITRLTTDPSTNTLYTVSETAQPDGTTELAVYSFEAASQNGGRTSDVGSLSLALQRCRNSLADTKSHLGA